MVEMVAEGTPPMSVPRDSREEALLICEAKQSENCLLYYLETLIKEKSTIMLYWIWKQEDTI